MNRKRLDRLWPTIGDKVQWRRLKVGMTQQELANRVNLTRTSIVNLEKGRQRLTLDNLIKVCRVLDVPLAFLVSGF